MKQSELIMDYLKRYGSISPMEAFVALGITKLATRISEMSKDGVLFDRTMETNVNQFGRKVSYMRYRLRKEA